MAQRSPIIAIVPILWIKSTQAVDLDLTGQICITQDIVPRHVELWRTLCGITEEYHRGSFDIIVVF